MKYKDTVWPSGSSIAGEGLSANGEYLGEQVGTPMQGKDETAANTDPFFAAHNTMRQGTMTQDAGDTNFPDLVYLVSYDLNGAIGTTPAATYQADEGAEITVSAAPTVTAYPEGKTAFDKWNTKADGTGTAYAVSAKFTPTADTVLYATYKA